MYEKKPETYSDYKEYFADRLQRIELGEEKVASPKAPRSNEELLAQCIWFEKMLVQEGLKTENGTALQIHNPGRWNQEAGPDFRQAELVIDSKRVKGDVEIHYNASDWERHGHRKDPRYRRVILHVFMDNDDAKSTDQSFSGASIERLCMSKYVFPDIETIRRSLSLEDYPYGSSGGKGKCVHLWESVDPEWVAEFFDLAGRERMLGKLARLADCLVGESIEQVFYQALMSTMGYKGGKALFFLLAKRTPILELLDFINEAESEMRVLVFQAILFNVANLIPLENAAIDDPETQNYLSNLRLLWRKYAGYFTDRILPRTKQWFTGVRPVNFPTRRIAGISHLLNRFSTQNKSPVLYFASLFRAHTHLSLDKEIKSFLYHLQTQFVVDDKEDFWSRRCTFQSRPWKVARNLIGESRALSIVFNALLPVMLLFARQHRDADIETLCWRLFENFPRLPENVITRFMRYRLFEDQKLADSLLINECRQQALFQIFYDCCNSNEVTCEDCYFLRRFELLGEEDDDEV